MLYEDESSGDDIDISPESDYNFNGKSQVLNSLVNHLFIIQS